MITWNGIRTKGYKDIVIKKKSGLLKRINGKHPNSKQCSILFPYAEDDYRLNIPYRYMEGTDLNKNEMVSIHVYYAYIPNIEREMLIPFFLVGDS